MSQSKKRSRDEGEFDQEAGKEFITAMWRDKEGIIDQIKAFISIPNQSPLFDSEWASNGLMEQAVSLVSDWVANQNVPGLKQETIKLPDLTPLLFIEVPKSEGYSQDDTVLMYAHIDKQPPLTESWREGLHPYKAVEDGGKIYGRGGADDGYGTFAAIAAVKALKEQNCEHSRIVVIAECCEESGSVHLPAYLDHLGSRLGDVSLVVCLDSGCGDYERLWLTQTLRGVTVGTLKVEILTEGMHSGHASGIVPSSFRILRSVLSRLEDETTGEVCDKFHVQISDAVRKDAEKVAKILGTEVEEEFPLVDGAQCVAAGDTVEQCVPSLTYSFLDLVLNRTWRPQLAVTGVDGMPTLEAAGNVLRCHTAVKLSLRLPPTLDAKEASLELKKLLESDPPYGAKVTFTLDKSASGFKTPDMPKWLTDALSDGAKAYFNGKDFESTGEGGSIPFMGTKKFPKSDFIVTGVLGPGSNAHGPNEFLHIMQGIRVTCAVGFVVARHGRRE